MTGNRRANGHVVLDSTWAGRLGVRRSAGMYRIARRDLMVRLEQLQQAPMAQTLSPSAVPGGRGLTVNERSLNDIVALESHSHFVGFYEIEAFLVDSVRDFLASGLVTGDAAIVVATDAHLNSFERALMEAGIDLPEARRCGRYMELDASELLAKFMVDGMPDAARFRAAIGQLVSRATESACDVRICVEVVVVLWDEGKVAAAIALEDLWNDLATSDPWSLDECVSSTDHTGRAEPCEATHGPESRLDPSMIGLFRTAPRRGTRMAVTALGRLEAAPAAFDGQELFVGGAAWRASRAVGRDVGAAVMWSCEPMTLFARRSARERADSGRRTKGTKDAIIAPGPLT
jgi:hypothetical protein